MKKIFSIFLLLLVSCANHQGKGLRKNFVVPNIQTVGTENYLNVNSDYIFDQESLHTFELKIPESSLKKIDSDPTKEEYVEGILIFQGDTLSPVGIRYKGSVGAFVGCTSGKDWSNPSGKKICTKLSMKVKINWKGSKDKFYDGPRLAEINNLRILNIY